MEVEDYILDDDEEEYILADDAKDRIDEILGVPPVSGISNLEIGGDDYPTTSHLKNRVRYIPGDITLEYNDTLILRKP